MGRENIPIAVVNKVDDDQLPEDFQYITENTETSDLNMNRTISSLQVLVHCSVTGYLTHDTGIWFVSDQVICIAPSRTLNLCLKF